MNEEKVILVSDLDPLMPRYSVVDEQQYDLGTKCALHNLAGLPNETYYLKPEYNKRGQRTGGKHSSFKDRIYSNTPPWFKRQVTKIDTLGGQITIHTKK